MDEARTGCERLKGDVSEQAEFVSANELALDGLASIIPICRCGAAPCRRGVTDEGRAYLTCCIKKGFGSCGYFKWVDPDMLRLEDLLEQFNFDRLRLKETAKKLRKQVDMIKKRGQWSEAGGSQAVGSQAASQLSGAQAASQLSGAQAASQLSGAQNE